MKVKSYKRVGNFERALKNLSSPKFPLSGRGNTRISVDYDLVKNLSKILHVQYGNRPKEINHKHIVTVYGRARGRWGKSEATHYISPEMHSLLEVNSHLIPFIGLTKREKRDLLMTMVCENC